MWLSQVVVVVAQSTVQAVVGVQVDIGSQHRLLRGHHLQ
jgi:hypothetical protein